MTVQVLPTALDDLAAGRCFYERQGRGLGSYFLDSLFADIDSLALYAGIHQRVFGYHRLLAKRFPYAIYYTVQGEVAVVWRVLDLRRDPLRIRRALDHPEGTP
jgi:plasmid stabilization system protein ParE